MRVNAEAPPWSAASRHQFGARLFQLRLKPRLVGMQLGMAVGQSLQLIEHGRHIARHPELIASVTVNQQRSPICNMGRDIPSRASGKPQACRCM
jgi:hypothetical protein